MSGLRQARTGQKTAAYTVRFAQHASSTRTGCCVIWGAGAAPDEVATARGRRLPILRRYKDDSDDPASVAMARITWRRPRPLLPLILAVWQPPNGDDVAFAGVVVGQGLEVTNLQFNVFVWIVLSRL